MNYHKLLQDAQNDIPGLTLGIQKQEMINYIMKHNANQDESLRDESKQPPKETVVRLITNAEGWEHQFPASSTHEARRIVTLCGSTRYALDYFKMFELELTLKGFIVLTIGCNSHSDDDLETMGMLNVTKTALDMLHFDKIKISDYVMVLNAGDEEKEGWADYVGESTGREVAYARSLKKEIWWMWRHTCKEGCNCRVSVS